MNKQIPKTSSSHPIYINFINHNWNNSGAKLGITFAPGKKQLNALSGIWDRDLILDLTRIKNYYNINTLVSLLEKQQFTKLKIQNQLEACSNMGIKAFNFPVTDEYIPQDKDAYLNLVKEIVVNYLFKGKNVVVHCMGGLGRAPTFAAACLICAGLNPAKSIEIVKQARSGSLTNNFQIEFLENIKF